jgi:hypothetical protein
VGFGGRVLAEVRERIGVDWFGVPFYLFLFLFQLSLSFLSHQQLHVRSPGAIAFDESVDALLLLRHRENGKKKRSTTEGGREEREKGGEHERRPRCDER